MNTAKAITITLKFENAPALPYHAPLHVDSAAEGVVVTAGDDFDRVIGFATAPGSTEVALAWTDWREDMDTAKLVGLHPIIRRADKFGGSGSTLIGDHTPIKAVEIDNPYA